MLLFLMLAVAVLTITMLGVARNYKRAILRDREVEMIHRGEQYERAVRRFYLKNSRYPASLEQLENMNKIRYLRKRYKDPMSPDGEWKLVHPTDIKITATGIQPAVPPGQNAGSTAAGTDTGNTTGGSATGTNSGSAFGNSGSSGTGTSGSAFGNSGSSGTGTSGSAFGNSGGSGTGSTGSAFGNSGSTIGSPTSGAGGVGNAANGQVLGGGDVYGVVSKSKKEGFHIYGEKSKYNEWFFIYAPSMDKGQLLVGPYNPKMFVGTANSGLNSGTGTPGSPGTLGNTGTSAFGASPTSTPTPQQPAQPAQPTTPNQ